jgi:hypothetical protein
MKRLRVKINFTDFWHPPIPDEIRNNTIYKLLSKKFVLELSDEPDFLVYSCSGNDYLKYKCIRILYVGENSRPNFNECDYAFSFDYPVTERNYRLPLYRLYDEYEQLKQIRDVGKIMSEKHNFCNFVFSNKRAKERIEFFQKLQKYKRVDSGGKVLNNISYLVEDKIAFQRQYKFTIAFENSMYPGYTTEKIMHALIANTIPIYWGNPLVGKDFNPKAFINCHEYDSFDDVIKKVIEINEDDDLYRKYLSEPYFPDGLENEYVKEENIIERFEGIFSVAKPYVNKRWDTLKWYGSSFRKSLRSLKSHLRRAVSRTKSNNGIS